ncbi:hypothetical protein ACSS7Z_14870 [Microbacterium sp. A82]|uniref:hypothetical protein n=1 Tax=unclassified Microbacterium TaxID=2609290 RepID=UPI003F3FCBC1
MRILALALGALLLVGGGALVVLADQEREAALEQMHQNVAVLDANLERARNENLQRAEQLTALRSAIAEQRAQLADTDGFLE